MVRQAAPYEERRVEPGLRVGCKVPVVRKDMSGSGVAFDFANLRGLEHRWKARLCGVTSNHPTRKRHHSTYSCPTTGPRHTPRAEFDLKYR